jgi:hypothetical protein
MLLVAQVATAREAENRPRRRRSLLLNDGSRVRCIVSGEYAIKLPAYLGQETAGLGDLAAVSSLRHLYGGCGNLPHEVTQLEQVLPIVLSRSLPRSPKLLPVLPHVGAALVGEMGDLTSLGLLDPHESFILQLLQRGIDGARARIPESLAALTYLLDDLVSVHGTLG